MIDIKVKVDRQSRLIVDMAGEITKIKEGARARGDVSLEEEAETSFKLNLPLKNIEEMRELEEAIAEDDSKSKLLVIYFKIYVKGGFISRLSIVYKKSEKIGWKWQKCYISFSIIICNHSISW